MKTNGELKPTLEKLMSENDVVFIVPHNRPDFDALGASVGMSLIASKKYKKRNYIVINDEYEKLPLEIRKMIDEISTRYNIIKVEDINLLKSDNSLMIAVDVNKDYLISTKDCLDTFKDILVIDHHLPDDHTISTPNLFIDSTLSSTCEEISKLIFGLGVKISPTDANYLLSGIVLDTSRLTKNLSPKTFNVLSKLTERGADTATVNNLFLEDFEHDRIIQKLINDTQFLRYSFAIAADASDSERIYTIEDIAICADYILRYAVDASFSMAYIDQDVISVSARSKGAFDVSKIMSKLGGGGNPTSAATRIKGHKISEVKEYLQLLLLPYNLNTIEFEEFCKELNSNKLIKKL